MIIKADEAENHFILPVEMYILQYCGGRRVCSVPWGRGGCSAPWGRGGCSVPWGDIMSTVGDIEYCGGCSVPWGYLEYCGG